MSVRLLRSALFDDSVVTLTEDGTLESRDLRNGGVRWRSEAPPGNGEEVSLYRVGGTVLRGTRMRLSALDGKSGATLWTGKQEGNNGLPLSTAILMSRSGGEDWVRIQDGRPAWSTRERNQGAEESDGEVFLATDQHVRRVRAADGVEAWRCDMPLPSMRPGQLFAAGPFLVVGSYSFDEAWTVVLNRATGRIAASRLGSSPVAARFEGARQVLAVAFDSGEIALIRPEGEFKTAVQGVGSYFLGRGHIRTQFQVVRNRLYAVSWDSSSVDLKATCIRLDDGALAWSAPLETFPADHSVYCHTAKFELRDRRLVIADVQAAGDGAFVLDADSGRVLASWQRSWKTADEGDLR